MANTLRGGKRSYVSKCLLNNFQEDGGTEARNVTHTQYQSTSMIMGYAGRKEQPRFGNSLGAEEVRKQSNPLDMGYVCDYRTVTQNSHGNPRAPPIKSEFSSAFMLTGGISSQSKIDECKCLKGLTDIHLFLVPKYDTPILHLTFRCVEVDQRRRHGTVKIQDRHEWATVDKGRRHNKAVLFSFFCKIDRQVR